MKCVNMSLRDELLSMFNALTPEYQEKAILYAWALLIGEQYDPVSGEGKTA